MRLTEFTEAAQIKTDDNFRTYRALQSIEKNMNAQGLKGPQALEFLQTSLLDIALNIVGREKRAGYEPHVVNVKNWADAKEFLMTAFRDAREQGVTESGEDRSHFIRHNIWTVMDGDEEVMQHPVEGDPFFSAKKFIRDLDDEGYEFTHVVSPEGKVTYLPHLDPRNFPKDEVDEAADEKKSFKVTYTNPKTEENKVVKIKAHNKDEVLDYCVSKGYKDVSVDEITSEGYRVVPGYDKEKYQEREGLEGPFHTKSGKVVYYDKKEGSYYDPDTDMYVSYEDWQAMNEEGVAEAGFGRATGRAAWDSNMPGYQGDYGGAANWGRRHREDDEHHEIDRRQEQQAASGTWYITIDGKLLKNKEGQPYSFVGKAAATKAAQTMMAKPFNQGKKFMLTTKGA